MILPTKKSFFSIICLLLLSHPLTGMKRPGSDRTTTKRRRTARTATALIPAALQEQTCPYLPNDLWTSIALEDLSLLYTLRRTCSAINNALKPLSSNYIQNGITEDPTFAKKIACNFYICTHLLHDYGKQRNEQAFNALWDSQSIHDKGIRMHFVRTLSKSLAKPTTVTPFLLFNNENTIPSSTAHDKNQFNYYHPIALYHYLKDALLKKNPQCVHLAATFYDKAIPTHHPPHGYTYWKNIAYQACVFSTAQCLTIILNYQLACRNYELKNYNENLLHCILSSSLRQFDYNHREEKVEKIRSVLEFYKKKYSPKKVNALINHTSKFGTPLSYAIRLFSDRKIFLEELISIIALLLDYGADPQKHIVYDANTQTHKTVFDIISKYTQSTYEPQFITPEEADIIVDCLNGK
jgi:hypothetical protein